MDVMNEKVVVFRKKKAEIYDQLSVLSYPMLDNKYDYLIDMKISSFTEEKIEELKKEEQVELAKLEELKEKTHIMLWKEDLSKLESLL